MNARKIGYWATTGLLSAAMLMSAAMYLTGQMNDAMGHLAFPAWFAMWLGTWKLLGAITLLAPRFPRLKEWAYAGFFVTFTSAVVAHLAVGDGAGGAAAPIVMLGLLGASWALRPADRALGTLPLG